MKANYLRACCIDASVLVKCYSDEDGSDSAKAFINKESSIYTTPFCFYEALGVLKVKHLYRKELTKEQYLTACFNLAADYSGWLHLADDIDLCQPPYLIRSIDIAKKYSIDLSDAFQILSVKEGIHSCGYEGSATILVTADSKLADVAKAEGLRVLNIMVGCE